MRYPLDAFETIPISAQLQLLAFDIHTTDDLLERAATPRLRERLAQEVGIPVNELTNWVGIADLVRIKGIGPAYAQLLVRSGLVGNVQGFLHVLGVAKPDSERESTGRIADREEVRLAASESARQLKEFAGRQGIDARVPVVRELAEAVEEAAELRPRLVLAASDDEGEFRQYVFAQYRKGSQHLWKFSLASLGTVAGAIVLIFVGMLITHIQPRLETRLLETRAEIAALALQDESIRQRRDQRLDAFDEILMDDWLAYGVVISEDDTEVLDVGVPLALNMVVWLAITAAALLFVLPYLVLGGWGRGLFYMIVLSFSFFIENALQKGAPTWFSLKSPSVGSVLIIALAVFANALFFDWLFEWATKRTKVCPGCQAQLDEYDMHCSVCGLVQP